MIFDVSNVMQENESMLLSLVHSLSAREPNAVSQSVVHRILAVHDHYEAIHVVGVFGSRLWGQRKDFVPHRVAIVCDI